MYLHKIRAILSIGSLLEDATMLFHANFREDDFRNVLGGTLEIADELTQGRICPPFAFGQRLHYVPSLPAKQTHSESALGTTL